MIDSSHSNESFISIIRKYISKVINLNENGLTNQTYFEWYEFDVVALYSYSLQPATNKLTL